MRAGLYISGRQSVVMGIQLDPKRKHRGRRIGTRRHCFSVHIAFSPDYFEQQGNLTIKGIE
jgi:hypothetical protein